jgi:hypothetical protein
MLVPATLAQGLGQSIGTLCLSMSSLQVHDPAGNGRGGYCSTSCVASTAGASSSYASHTQAAQHGTDTHVSGQLRRAVQS